MTLINPMIGFYGMGSYSPILPSYYTEYYSQEDRLKAQAEIIQRLLKWNELLLEKMDEVIDVVNNSEAADVQVLRNEVKELSLIIDEIYSE